MLAIEIQKYNINAQDILSDELNVKVLNAIARFARLLPIYGYQAKICSKCSLNKLQELSSEKKEQIYFNFKNWADWIDPGESNEPIKDIEKICIEKVLNHYNLQASDEFWKTLRKDQIVEVYGSDMIQLYRSLSFFSITNYSLLDISVFEWYVLWSRPSKAIEETMNDLKDVLAHNTPVKKFQIPKQLIREVYNTNLAVEPFMEKAVLAEFLFSGSLMQKEPNNNHATPKGFICSSFAKVIAVGQEAANIQFI